MLRLTPLRGATSVPGHRPIGALFGTAPPILRLREIATVGISEVELGIIASSVIWVLVAITILVFVHEMGHFLAARLFKMRIDRFSIGFPPTIFKKKVGETEWAIGATPLGGYVKIAGMVDESMDTDFAGKDPEPWEFRSKPVWKRIIVISAGVTFNMLLAAVIFSGIKMTTGEAWPLATDDGLVFIPDSSIAAQDIGLRTGDRVIAVDGRSLATVRSPRDWAALSDPFTWDVERAGESLTLTTAKDIFPRSADASDGGVLGLGIYNWPATLGQVQEDGVAYDAGMRPGDRVVAVDGEAVALWLDLTSRIQAADGAALEITWIRPATGERFNRGVMPERMEDGQYRVGIQVAQTHERYGPGSAIVAGIADTWTFTGAILSSLRNIATGRESVRESIGGPVMVAKIASEAAQAGAAQFWRLVALLSITLAIVNILPVPVLDGGHLVFLIYEGIRRREPSLKVRMATQQVGMVLLLVLMAFLVFNDLDRIFRFLQ